MIKQQSTRNTRRRRSLVESLATAARMSLPASPKNREEIVASMIRERDEEISILRRELLNDKQILGQVQSELNRFRTLYKEQIQLYHVTEEALKRQNDGMREQIRELNEGLNSESLIKEYADAIRRASPSKMNASYVSSIQSQLCIAMHKVEVLKTQLNIVERNNKEMVDALRDKAAKLIDEKCRTETEMMNRLNALNNEKNSIEDQYKAKLRHREETIAQLESKLDESRTRETSEVATGRGIWSSSEGNSEDMAVTLQVLKDHLDIVAREKESLERKVKAKDETIILLREGNEANNKTSAQVSLKNCDKCQSEHRQDDEESEQSVSSSSSISDRSDESEESRSDDEIFELGDNARAAKSEKPEDVMCTTEKSEDASSLNKDCSSTVETDASDDDDSAQSRLAFRTNKQEISAVQGKMISIRISS